MPEVNHEDVFILQRLKKDNVLPDLRIFAEALWDEPNKTPQSMVHELTFGLDGLDTKILEAATQLVVSIDPDTPYAQGVIEMSHYYNLSENITYKEAYERLLHIAEHERYDAFYAFIELANNIVKGTQYIDFAIPPSLVTGCFYDMYVPYADFDESIVQNILNLLINKDLDPYIDLRKYAIEEVLNQITLISTTLNKEEAEIKFLKLYQAIQIVRPFVQSLDVYPILCDLLSSAIYSHEIKYHLVHLERDHRQLGFK